MIPGFTACMTEWKVALFIKMGAQVEEQMAGANCESICEVCARRPAWVVHIYGVQRKHLFWRFKFESNSKKLLFTVGFSKLAWSTIIRNL